MVGPVPTVHALRMAEDTMERLYREAKTTSARWRRTVVAVAVVVAAFAAASTGALQAQQAPAAPAAEVKLWTSSAPADEGEKTPAGSLGPVTIVAARNGTFSGKVVADSSGPIRGLKGSVGDLTCDGATIPARCIQVRYAVPWEQRNWGWPSHPDILLESAPEAIQADARRTLAPVWVTVAVPKDARAGVYTGELVVQAEGLSATKVPVKLDVQDWTLPDAQAYRTWMDFVQSPDTLSLEYNVPLWSQKHWELIQRSFRLIRDTGSRVLYVPLICRTNFGNEQSMVRWIDKGNGTYDHDYTVMDRYFDTGEESMGKPKLVIFVVWDICQSKKSLTRSLWGGDTGKNTREAREELLGKGPRVTTLDPATGETGMAFLPRYEEPGGQALWRPVWAQIRKRMAARGLDGSMMLGILSDLWPDKDEVTSLNELTGGLAWVSHAHAGKLSDTNANNRILHGVADLGYAAHVYNLCYQVNPAKERLYGWRRGALVAHFPRGSDLNMSPNAEIRQLGAFNITGDQRGAGRLGADLWSVIRDRRGRRAGAAYERYPENKWRNLDIGSWFLAPGPDGALATARYENLREGVQECEARIALEEALLAPSRRSLLGSDLADRCQKALDEHHRAMWKTVWSNDEDLARIGTAPSGRNPVEGLWQALAKDGKKLPGFWEGEARKMRSEEAAKGRQEWLAGGWQERTKKLFALAGEVSRKLNRKP